MKVYIISKSTQAKRKFQKALRKHNIKEGKKADLIISLGGDGTFLFAERSHPGIPKFLYRDHSICNKCSNEDVAEMVRDLKLKQYTTESHQKIQAIVKKKKLLAVNDIIIRNEKPNEAIRFSVLINNKKHYPDMIGDGIVVATPFGSTAYFKAITGWSFGEGLGIAFNNATINQPSAVVQDTAIITFRLERGHALLAADNDPDMISLKEGDRVKIMSAKSKAHIIRTKYQVKHEKPA